MKSRLIAAVMLATGSALAQTPPTPPSPPAGVNMAQPILNPDGTPVGDVDCAKPAVPATDKDPAQPGVGCHKFTIGYALEMILMQSFYPNDDKIDPTTLTAQKVAAYFLAERIKPKAEALSVTGESYLTLTPTEVEYIRKHVALRFSPPFIVGQIVQAVDPVGSREFK